MAVFCTLYGNDVAIIHLKLAEPIQTLSYRSASLVQSCSCGTKWEVTYGLVRTNGHDA